MNEDINEASLPPIALLKLLADGELHSGQELADVLGVSRTTVWKQLAKLELLGLELQSQSGKGYRLLGGLNLLDTTIIESYLLSSTKNEIGGTQIFSLIDSTNAYLMRSAALPYISICLAECQTAGRGRRGRTWISPFARNIYLSLKMTIESGIGALEGLSLAIGVAVARALQSSGVDDVQLKWPNDVLWSGRKLGGVLIEISGDPAGRCHIVIGLGLNVVATKSMQDVIEQPWVALSDILGSPPDRNQIVSALLNQIVPLLTNYERDGFRCYQQEWMTLNAHANQPVNLHHGNSAIAGTVLGVNETGALLLATDNGMQVFHGGEVSLRGIE